MTEPRFQYAAGIINYQSYPDLELCIASLNTQSLPPSQITVIDHDPDPRNFRVARSRHLGVTWDPCPNRGFAAGANRLIARSRVGSEYLLFLNPDIQLDPKFAERLLVEMARHPKAALGSGKLLRPGGDRIDSAGIEIGRSRRLYDRGSGELDRGQYDQTERVFGVSGAALMLRRSAVPDLEVNGEVFDEDFFTYHEETDLAWRAGLLGWSALYVPGATAIHRRGWNAGAWKEIDPEVRRHSFTNRYLEMIKNERPAQFFRDLHTIAAWDLLRIGHALLRDRRRIPNYGSALRLAGRAWRKRRLIQERVRLIGVEKSNRSHPTG